jgi:hypothetical protein
VLQKCVLPQIDGNEQEETVQFCFKKTVIYPTLFIKYEVPWASDFLGGRFEEADQLHGPHAFHASHKLDFFSVGIYKIPRLHTENPRFK